MQNWQQRTEYSEEVTTYRPEVYSVVMNIPTNRRKNPSTGSQLDIDLANSRGSLGSHRKIKDQSGWFNAIPRLIRRLTASQIDISGNNKNLWVNLFV